MRRKTIKISIKLIFFKNNIYDNSLSPNLVGRERNIQ